MKNKRIGKYRILDKRVKLFAAEDIILNDRVIYKEGSFIKSIIVRNDMMKIPFLPFGKYYIQDTSYAKIALMTVRR